MFEWTNPHQCYVCPCRDECCHRLGIWYSTNLLRLEHPYGSAYKDHGHFGPFIGFLVSIRILHSYKANILSASTATIVRIVYIRSLTLTDDYSWEGINLVKWSLVEPAIAITAMNIATLRPMFKNFFFFARKRFDHSTDSSDNTRPSGESTVKLRSGSNNNNTVSAKEYSVEFAEMLGLSRVGVTTEISAGGSKSERSRLRSRFQSSRMGVSLRDFKTEKVKHDSESQTELNEGLSIWHLDGSASDPLDWSQGIKATTVITRVDDR